MGRGRTHILQEKGFSLRKANFNIGNLPYTQVFPPKKRMTYIMDMDYKVINICSSEGVFHKDARKQTF